MKSKDNPNRLEPWTITQLQVEFNHDLTQCQSQLERTNAEAYHRLELKKAAAEFSKTRKLTPHEVAILEMNGVAI